MKISDGLLTSFFFLYRTSSLLLYNNLYILIVGSGSPKSLDALNMPVMLCLRKYWMTLKTKPIIMGAPMEICKKSRSKPV